MLHEDFSKAIVFGHSMFESVIHTSFPNEIIGGGVSLTDERVNRIFLTLKDVAHSEFDCELRTANCDSKWHLVGIRVCGEKRMVYKDDEPSPSQSSSVENAALIGPVPVPNDTTSSSIAVPGLSVYHKLLMSITTPPKAMTGFTHLCIPHLSQSTLGSLASVLANLMEHVNAPSFTSACYAFHSTAIYVSFALGRLLTAPCDLTWTPTRSEACTSCGLLISENGSCLGCTLCTCGVVNNFGSNVDPFTNVESEEFEESFIKRDCLTNACANMLRHVEQES